MIVLRLVAMLIFTALLTGCTVAETAQTRLYTLKGYIAGQTTQNPCILGIPQIAECYYVVTITTANYNKGLIRGKTALKVCEQNRDSGNADEKCTDWLSRRSEIPFPVKGSPDLQKNSDYEFFSQVTDPPTPELVCIDLSGKITSQCTPRTTPLPRVP